MSTNANFEDTKKGLQSRRIDIQVIRGIAVLAVVLFHTNESWFIAGYLGVDLFFVISGFVVTPLISRIFSQSDTYRVQDSIYGLKDFYARRFFRLAPALGVTLIFSLVLVLLFGPVFDHERFASQGLAALFMLGNLGAYSFSGGNYFAPNPNPLIHLWSLSAEEQIYLFLPLIVFIYSFVTKSRKGISLKLIISLGFLAYLFDIAIRMFPDFLQKFGITDVPGLMFYSPVSRLWEFCLGSAVYLVGNRKTIPFEKLIKYLNLVIVVLISGMLFLPISGNRFQSVTICLLASIALFFGAFESLPSFFRRRLIWLGDRSYSIYLIHMPLLYVANYSPILESARSLAVFVAFAASISVGAIIYQYIEERFRVKNSQHVYQISTFRSLFIYSILIPILLFSGMRYCSAQDFWGLNPNLDLPIYASDADPTCLVAVSPCENLTKNAKGAALLIGDSHAAPLFQTFNEAMSAEKVSSYVLQKNGCYFIVRNLVSKRDAESLGYDIPRPDEPQSCFSHNQSIVEWLQSNPNSVVIISQRSSSNRPARIGEAQFRKILLRNLNFLKSLSTQLIVIGPNPEFPDEKQFFRGSQLVWQKTYIPPKSFPIDSMIPEPMNDNEFFMSRLDSQGIKYFDSISLFCTPSSCTRWDQARWLFVDDDHLSQYGAQKLRPLFQQIALLSF